MRMARGNKRGKLIAFIYREITKITDSILDGVFFRKKQEVWPKLTCFGVFGVLGVLFAFFDKVFVFSLFFSCFLLCKKQQEKNNEKRPQTEKNKWKKERLSFYCLIFFCRKTEVKKGLKPFLFDFVKKTKNKTFFIWFREPS